MKKITLAGNLTEKNSLSHLISFRWVRKQTIIETISLLFVILFLYTAISKLMEYTVFKEQLATSPVLKPVASIVALALPVTEIIVAIALFTHRLRLYGLYASFGLMILFTGYIGAILLFSSEIPCSCGGILGELSWVQHLFVNTALTILALLAIRLIKNG